MQITCSLKGCAKEILGSVVVLGNEEGEMSWGEYVEAEGMYHGQKDDGVKTSFIMLHPRCFHQLIDEALRQEGAAALTMIFGAIGDVKDALGMPDE